MADDYLHFSFALGITKKEKEWLLDLWDGLSRFGNDSKTKSPLVREFLKQDRSLKSEVEEGSIDSIEMHIEKVVRGAEVVFYTEQAGSPWLAGQFVRFFFRKNRAGKHCAVGFTWSETCNVMRPDHFGGGGVFVTEDKVETLSAWGWVEKMMVDHNKKQNRKTRKRR